MRKHISPIEDLEIELGVYETASAAIERKIMELDPESTDEYVTLAFQLQFSNSMIWETSNKITKLNSKPETGGLIRRITRRN
jgi:hypothetical protein